MTKINSTLSLKRCFCLALTLVALLLVSCENLVGPPVDCEQNHKGTLKVKNKSDHTTYKVLVNGVSWGTFKPGKWEANAVTAGVQHTVEFLFANSNKPACSPGFPNVPQCEAREISCKTEE